MAARLFARRIQLGVWTTFACVTLLVDTTRAQCPEDQLITSSTAAAGDQMGVGVGIDGDWLAVGIWGKDGSLGTDAGAVVIYRRNSLTGSWDEMELLTASDGAAGDHFGSAVSLSGDWLAVGAPNHTHQGMQDAGAVYLFQNVKGSWVEELKVTGCVPGARGRDVV